jgi:hypothetical protein
MYGQYPSYCFYLDIDGIVYDQIEPVSTIQLEAAVLDW